MVGRYQALLAGYTYAAGNVVVFAQIAHVSVATSREVLEDLRHVQDGSLNSP